MLNQQFFVFFEEQQQVARILREGLRAEGMKSNLLLPEPRNFKAFQRLLKVFNMFFKRFLKVFRGF